jgi:hypothetical protein
MPQLHSQGLPALIRLFEGERIGWQRMPSTGMDSLIDIPAVGQQNMKFENV